MEQGAAVNRAESDTTHTPFDDNNKGKSLGGRLGFTPFPGGTLLNFGLGGFWGPEQDDDNVAGEHGPFLRRGREPADPARRDSVRRDISQARGKMRARKGIRVPLNRRAS